jgi:hypothetical protein
MTSRCLRRLLAGAAALTLAPALGVALGTTAAHATPSTDTTETQLLTLLNTARAGQGLGPLAVDPAITHVARTWSDHMVTVHTRTGDPVINPAAPTDCDQSALCHNPNLATAVGALVPGWTRIGENIGVGADATTVNQALLNSPGHYANIMGDYNRVGIGVTTDGTRIWATFDFANAPGTPAPAISTGSVRGADPATSPVAVIGTNGKFNPVVPVRIADTRGGQGVVPAGGVLRVPVVGVAGVPADATGVVVNLTAAAAQTAGYLTAYPCGAAAPTASNLNVSAGETRANQAAVAVDSTKAICVFSSTATDMIVDLAGWYGPTGSAYQPLAPARVFDSRSTGAATTFTVPMPSAPADATAVTVNLTVTNPAAAGYLTAYPCGMTAPLVSNVNFAGGQTIANLATVRLGSAKDICLSSPVPTNVIVDLAGVFSKSGATFTSAVTTRLLDTRDGTGGWTGQADAGQVIELSVAGTRGIPTAANSVVVNLTATGTTGPGYVAAYPCGQAQPEVSNLNFDGGAPAANLATVRLSATGTLCLSANVGTHLVADIAGWYTN